MRAKNSESKDPLPSPSSAPAGREEDWISRARVLALTFVLATGIVFYLCYRLVLPFLPALAWALALAVIAHPVHRWVKRLMSHANLAAGLSVVIVALLIVGPVVVVTQYVVREARNYLETIQDEIASGRWRAALERNQKLKPVVGWIESQLSTNNSDREQVAESEPPVNGRRGKPLGEDVEATSLLRASAPAERAANMLSRGVSSVATGTLWVGMQVFITCVALFFFLRDRHLMLGFLRSLMPLANAEADELFSRVNDTIHATIYGSVFVGLVQGTMGGVMFWWMGLPSPFIWGAVMSLLALVPMLGTFVVWAPMAIYLALQGDWTKAVVLAVWGAVAIGLIDNILYPFVVGKRLRLHPLPVFFAVLGGLALFGASGVILGPLVLAIADALVHVWRERTALGRTIEVDVEPTL